MDAAWPACRSGRATGYDAALRTATAWAGGTVEALGKKAADHNLIIGEAMSKANDVFVEFRLSGQTITSEGFLYAYNTEGNKKYTLSRSASQWLAEVKQLA